MQRLGLALKLTASYTSRLPRRPCEDKRNPFEIKSTADSLGSIRAFSIFKTWMLLQRGLALIHIQMQACSPLQVAPFVLCQRLNRQPRFREED